jgi:acyl phosphate:glycerol-3-phosphate acyltransferase
MTEYVVVIPLAYLLGSIPFGLLLTRLAGHGDIRAIGSGNIGATNVLRTGNKPLALLTLLLDGGKGAAAVLLAGVFFPGTEIVAGIAALLGHMFPVWLKGKGGKGVATAVGVITVLSWPLGVGIMLAWLAFAFLFRYSSLAAIVSLGLAPFCAASIGRKDLLGLTAIIAILVIAKHAANIKRLLKKTEPKIGKDKDAASFS